MTFRYAEDLPDRESLTTDICIVGAGAAGITLALQLERSRYRILLLESGDLRPSAEADELDQLEIAGHPFNVEARVRRRALGGTTTATYGRSVLLDPIDYASRPWISQQGWPLSRTEIAHWYPQAAEVLALERPELLEASHWQRHAMTQAAAECGLATRIHRWGGHVDLGTAWALRLRKSGNVTVLLRGTAVRCEAAPGGRRIRQIACRGLGGGHFSVRARAFVLACGGLENPRLLLLSRKGPDAPRINWDPVGRYYMNHPRAEAIARIYPGPCAGLSDRRKQAGWLRMLVKHRSTDAPGRLQFALSPDETMQFREQLLNVSSFFFAVSDRKARTARQKAMDFRAAWPKAKMASMPALGSLLPHTPYLAGGALHRLRDRPYRVEYLTAVDQCEQQPDPASRVTLAEGCDRFGCPKLRLDWRIDSGVTRSLRRLHGLLSDFFTRLGIGRFESKLLHDPGFEPDYMDCAHPSGTTRMSIQAEHGVVDRDCRVHGVENLFVAGSSVFPVGGHASPTFIIIALAARLAALLADKLPADMDDGRQ